MSRRPIYSKDGQIRVVYAGNGLWQMEQHTGEKGTNEKSPWFRRGQPADHETAVRALGPLQ